MKLYVEGGGNGKSLRAECRRGFTEFLKKTRSHGSLPRVVSCGSRRNAYESFCAAVANGEPAMLLVDSEASVASQHQQDLPESWLPWEHLTGRVGDGWERPNSATSEDCHLMVQCMESWFLADVDTLRSFFGQGFRAEALPGNPDIEKISKKDVFVALANSTRECKPKRPYGKGEHSFGILARIDPEKVSNASGWAKRFVDVLYERMT